MKSKSYALKNLNYPVLKLSTELHSKSECKFKVWPNRVLYKA